jgi:electron transfer flavoprotein alpha subunit
MPDILVFSEKDEVTFELLSWGRRVRDVFNAKLAVAVLGTGAREKAPACFAYGADKVYWSENALLKDFHSEVYAEALYQIAGACHPGVLLIGSTRRGKDLAPRVAQKWGAGCITDAIDINVKDKELVVSRYTLGGNTISSEVLRTANKVISVMPKAVELGNKEARQGELLEIVLNLKEPRLKIVDRKAKQGETVSLEEAQTLVCVGRGLNKKEDLATIEGLAKAMKAEIGCTRPLSHDWQWLSEEREVGLSGKKCKPRLCVSIGISGQIQHIVGIRDSKIIVAVNKDKSAPIFEITDYGVVGDLYEVVPLLTEKIKNLKF